MSRLERITSDSQVCHGKPVIRGLRIPVVTVLELMAGGMTPEELLEDFPDLTREDLLAALEYGALMAGGQVAVPLNEGTPPPSGGHVSVLTSNR
ncbi:DUF433 domain-containing protein [Myceligenerans crystallogenes]